MCLSTAHKSILWPSLIEKAVSSRSPNAAPIPASGVRCLVSLLLCSSCTPCPATLAVTTRACAVAVPVAVAVATVIASTVSSRVVRGRATLGVAVPPSMLTMRGLRIVVPVVITSPVPPILMGALRRQRLEEMMLVSW